MQHSDNPGKRRPQHLTPEQALQKLKHFCAYQERCHSEVREKLYALGVRSREHDEIITRLIEENYLNEERFAIAFAGGKWRINHWGRVKIRFALKQKQISEYCIRKAMKEIGEDEYREVLQRLANEKYGSLRKHQHLVRRKKTIDYLVGRGFENGLVLEMMQNLTDNP